MTYNDQNNTAWSQLIVVLLLAVGAVWIQFPIEPDRPAPSGQGMNTRGIQDVDARLWQDPFEAVNKARQASSSECVTLKTSNKNVTLKSGACSAEPNHDFNWLKHLIQARRQTSPGIEKMKVMLAMVPGGNWVGADEARRRTRYAVLAGLNAEGYVPDDPEHIGYAKDEIDHLPLIMPFEMLGHADSGKAPLLLVWVDDETLLQDRWIKPCEDKKGCTLSGQRIAPRPLFRLVEIMKALGGTTDNTGYLLIGPSSSTFLKLAARESALEETLAALRQFRPRWYSPFATLPDANILIDEAQPLYKRLPEMTRVIADDDQVTTALVEELKLRKFGSGRAVALVGQWDTAYSRTLRDLLRDKLCLAGTADKNAATRCKEDAAAGNDAREKPAPADAGKKLAPAMWVLEENYTRGLDGKLPGQADKKSEEKPTIERPEGDGQIDYLRRLALKLKEREKVVGRIGAIGVLGNDYYDKLLVLKALRPAFPDAVFFSTDAYAAMLDRDDNKHTRNLVVAAGYGLSLGQPGQKDIAPFRDTYQTSAFHATRMAVGEIGKDRNVRPDARLFEVGRSELVPLDTPPGHGPDKKYIVGPLILAAMAWLISWAAGFTQRCHRCTWVLILSGTLLLSLLHYAARYTDEPMDWLQGVSIWPSEIIRLIAIALALALFWRGVSQMRLVRFQLDEAFFGRHDNKQDRHDSFCRIPKISVSGPRSRQALALWLYNHVGCASSANPPRESGPCLNGVEHKAMEIWDIYNGTRDCSNSPVFLRHPFWLNGLIFVAAYLLLAWTLKWLGLPPPTTPARGTLAFIADRAIVFCAVLAQVSLLFLAMYEGFRAVWLARKLQGPTRWPGPVIARFWPHETADKPDHRLFDPWLDMRFIALATVPVQRIIFYPFLVMSLMILARSTLFDRWHTPPFLIVIFGVSIALVVIAALRMRGSAEKVRQNSIEKLSTQIMELKARGAEDLARQLEAMLVQAREINIGAFAPLSQQPLIKATLTLAGSLSGIALLESVNQMNL